MKEKKVEEGSEGRERERRKVGEGKKEVKEGNVKEGMWGKERRKKASEARESEARKVKERSWRRKEGKK